MTTVTSARWWLVVALALALGSAMGLAAEPGAKPGDAPAGPGAAEAPAEVDLRPRFVAGRTARYEIWTLREQTATVRVGNQARTAGARLEIKGLVTWKVERVRPDGSATCAMTMDWLTADLTPEDGAVQHNDTRKAQGQTPPLHASLRAMAGVTLRLEVAGDGTMQKVSGVDQVRRKAGDIKVPDELDFLETASDLATLVGVPARVGRGAAWSVNQSWNHEAGKLHQSMRYVLSDVETIAGIPVATVSGSTKTRLEVDRAKLPQDVPVDVRLRAGQLSTQVMFDLQRHEAVGRNTVETRQIEVRIKLPDQTVARDMTERIHSQVLRVAEE